MWNSSASYIKLYGVVFLQKMKCILIKKIKDTGHQDENVCYNKEGFFMEEKN